MNDERLARRAAAGDRGAFEAIFRRYHQDLYRFCLATVGDPQDAQDALQNTMLKALRALPGERREIKLKPWLYRIARNEAVEMLRKRRPSAELEPEHSDPNPEIAETAAARERLRRLLADLEELPERQRAALVMRELADLDFSEIGSALATSPAVARQTLYEARLSLRQMEAGREMDCELVTRALSDGDGRVRRRRDVRAHLRGCAGCRAFRDGIATRRDKLAAISPLPLAASTALLQGILGGGAIATSALVKSAATVAVVAAVGITAADRSGLVDVPLPGGPDRERSVPATGSPAGTTGEGHVRGAALGERAGDAVARVHQAGKAEDGFPQNPGVEERDGVGKDGGEEAPQSFPPEPAAPPAEESPPGHRGQGQDEGLPASSGHGQETTAAPKAPQSNRFPGTPRVPGQVNAPGSLPLPGDPKLPVAPPPLPPGLPPGGAMPEPDLPDIPIPGPLGTEKPPATDTTKEARR